MATVEGLIQLPVPPGCVRDLRWPGEIGLLVVFAGPAAMAGSAVLSVCP
jgi:hypothetical protein